MKIQKNAFFEWSHIGVSKLKTNWKLWLSVSLLLIVILSATLVRVKKINGALPYPGHVDEPQLTVLASRMLITGDFNPHQFTYPSLPIYVTAAGFIVGFFKEASHGKVNSVKSIKGSYTYPFFGHPGMIWHAKIVFTAFSLLSMLLMGIVAYRAYENICLIFLTPLIIFFSASYFYYSSHYLNVDIIGVFFASLVYYYQFYYLKTDSFLHKSVIPGILTGLVIGCKYNLIWVIVPSILIILFYAEKQKILKILFLTFFMVVGFFIAVPCSLLEFDVFLSHIAYQVSHYKSGHSAFDLAPGYPQLANYMKEILSDFGWLTTIIAIIGLGSAMRLNWKNTLIITSFPVLLVAHMSMQSAANVRNILFLFVIYPIFVAMGVIGIYRLLGALRRYAWMTKLSERHQLWIKVVIITILFIIAFPMERPMKWAFAKPDARNSATQWINKNIAKGSTLIIPYELYFDTRDLTKKYKIVQWTFMKMDKQTYIESISANVGSYVLRPNWGFFHFWPSGKKQSDRLNSFNFDNDNVTVLQRFAGTPVLVNYGNTRVPEGNPSFSIGLIKK